MSQDYRISNNCKNKLVKIPTDTGELTVKMLLWISESMSSLGLGLEPVSQWKGRVRAVRQNMETSRFSLQEQVRLGLEGGLGLRCQWEQ